MTTMNLSSRLRLPLALALALPLASGACGGDDGGAEISDETDGDGDGDTTGDGDGDGDPTTGDGDGDGDGDPTTGDGDGDPTTGDGDGDGDGDTKPNLGDTPNVLCEAAIVNLDMIIAENGNAEPDAMTIEAAYAGTGLQEFVQYAGAVTGRVEGGVLIDDAAILESIDLALNGGDARDLVDAQWRIYLIMHKFIRHEVAGVASTLPDPSNDPALLYARWDDAYCYWDGALRPLAQVADGIGLAGDSIEADLDAAFERGHAGIEGEQPWAIDEWELGPAKQQVEKTSFGLVHRLVMQWSADAATEADADLAGILAHKAHGAFQLIEDRMEGRNTPGIAIIEDQLLADPADIDADDVLLQMNIAFAKRTRKYTDYALPDVGGLMGTAEGVTGATEGRAYSKVVEPFMLDLDGFDQAAYGEAWAAWIAAVADDDAVAGAAASAELTDWNCQLQAALGIDECTSSVDES